MMIMIMMMMTKMIMTAKTMIAKTITIKTIKKKMTHTPSSLVYICNNFKDFFGIVATMVHLKRLSGLPSPGFFVILNVNRLVV